MTTNRRSAMPTEREVLRKLFDDHPEFAQRLRGMVDDGTLKVGVPQGPVVIVASAAHGGITGARQRRCGCGQLVWLSPASQEILRSKADATMLCLSCMSRLVAEGQSSF